MRNGKFDINNRGPISTDFIGMNWRYPMSSYEERQASWEAHKAYTQEFFWFLTHDAQVPEALRTMVGSQWRLFVRGVVA